MDATPLHRRPPPLELLTAENNLDVKTILDMREAAKLVQGFPNKGPIAQASDDVKFCVSASNWSAEHLTRFQIVVLREQIAPYLFPGEYLLLDEDPTMKALTADGFFVPDESAIRKATWDRSKLHHFFYLTLLLLHRGGDSTPSPHNSPQRQEAHARAAKDAAREEILRIVNTATETSPDASRSSMDSYRTTSTTSSSARPDLGPRETLSFMYLHQFLNYIGTIEMNSNNLRPLWIAM
jgi:hypothetical protein